MKKATRESVPAVITGNIAEALTAFAFIRDAERSDLERAIYALNESISQYENDIESCQNSLDSLTEDRDTVQEKLDGLVPPTPPTGEEIAEDVTRLASLPWIETVEIREGNAYVRTRRDVLTWTAKEGYDENREETDLEKPITLPLPQYVIRVRMVGNSGQFANDAGNLGIMLADPEKDACEFACGDEHSYEPHAHWASEGRGLNAYEKLCLGEYESDVCGGFRKGLSYGLEALAIYLQTSGSRHAYRSKLRWSQWLGNPVYNKALGYETEEYPAKKMIVAVKPAAVIDGTSAATVMDMRIMPQRRREIGTWRLVGVDNARIGTLDDVHITPPDAPPSL